MRLAVVLLLAGCAPPRHHGELRGSIGGTPFQPRATLARWTTDHTSLAVRLTDFTCTCDTEEPLGTTPQRSLFFWLRAQDARVGMHEILPHPDRSPEITADLRGRRRLENGHILEDMSGINDGRIFVGAIDAHRLRIAFDIDNNSVVLRGATTIALCADGELIHRARIQ